MIQELGTHILETTFRQSNSITIGELRLHVWLQCVMISHCLGAKKATRGWGWPGSVTASGPWPHWEWTASEGNWGVAVGYNGEREGAPASSSYYSSLTAKTEAPVREKYGNRECTERGKKQKAEQKRCGGNLKKTLAINLSSKSYVTQWSTWNKHLQAFDWPVQFTADITSCCMK